MTVLSIDIETFSSVDLIKSGAYAYADSPDFEVLLFAFAFDDDPVTVIDLTDFENIPKDVLDALQSDVFKTAYNANFERTCLAKQLNIPMDPEYWRCTAVHAAYLGLPGTLDAVAKVMKLDAQKDARGKSLIRYFSVPCRPTKANGGRTRNYPHHDLEKWQQYIEYCRQDVVVERDIRKALEKFEIPEFEQKLWALDQKIVDRGVKVDSLLVDQAIKLDQQNSDRLMTEAKDLTGLSNPNSASQLKKWLGEKLGKEVKSLTKDTVPELIDQANDETVKRVLGLRQEMAKTSISKYEAMVRARCSDGRVRGILQFYGANRTGRWAGRLVQVQNLPRNYLEDLAEVRGLLRNGEFETIELLYGDVSDVLSQLIRTAIVPEEGYRFIVSDFSAIEARVIAWYAGEQWRLDVFNGHGKIYEASASQMFGIPLDQIDGELRQKGKVAELALGYQGGPGALKSMGALQQGLKEEELQPLVDSWREANPNIVRFWWDVGDAALTAVKEKRMVKLHHGLVFSYESGCLFIRLPSGRRLAYVRPKIEPNKFGRDAITYEGYENGRWSRVGTYGGKLVENIVQATARDCLAESLVRLDQAGYNIVMHVHDEVVLEEKETAHDSMLDHVTEIMGRPIDWAPGLPLKADGFVCEFYQKD